MKRSTLIKVFYGLLFLAIYFSFLEVSNRIVYSSSDNCALACYELGYMYYVPGHNISACECSSGNATFDLDWLQWLGSLNLSLPVVP